MPASQGSISAVAIGFNRNKAPKMMSQIPEAIYHPAPEMTPLRFEYRKKSHTPATHKMMPAIMAIVNIEIPGHAMMIIDAAMHRMPIKNIPQSWRLLFLEKTVVLIFGSFPRYRDITHDTRDSFDRIVVLRRCLRFDGR